MPDRLFERFHLETTPPPVQEVRRLGDRRRRRTAAAASIAGVAAAIVVAAPIVALGRGADRGEPQPSHTGSATGPQSDRTSPTCSQPAATKPG